MPELPEVETVARQLHPLLAGRTVVSCQTFDPKLSFRGELLGGAQVLRGFRHGKFVVLELRDTAGAKTFLAVHLRMTGRLLWDGRSKDDPELALLHADDGYLQKSNGSRKHLRAELAMDEGKLLFYDPRRFGTMEIYNSVEEIPVAGVDPMTAAFTVESLRLCLKGRRQPIKNSLLRQDLLSGIGNIYASEILFRARIHPRRHAARVRAKEIPLLHRSVRRVLEAAIKRCGTTFSDFQDASGEAGGFERFLRVYGREGKPCRTCKTPVRRIVQAGRSTFFCPKCQR